MTRVPGQYGHIADHAALDDFAVTNAAALVAAVDAAAAAVVSAAAAAASAALADVTRTNAVTLTNKTMSGASNTFSDLPPAAVTGTAVVTADARLSDARTPTAHAASHAAAGADPVTVTEAQVTGLVADLALKAPLASPTFTGVPAAPTAAAATNTTQVATTAFVRTEVSNLVAAAPAALDTLNELATALGGDAAFSTTVTNSLALKAPLASPALTGVPTVPTAAVDTNTTQAASTAFVIGQAGTATPLDVGVGAVGTSKKYSREDHVHTGSAGGGGFEMSFLLGGM